MLSSLIIQKERCYTNALSVYKIFCDGDEEGPKSNFNHEQASFKQLIS